MPKQRPGKHRRYSILPTAKAILHVLRLDVPAGVKRVGIRALLKVGNFPLGWYSKVYAEQEKMRVRRRERRNAVRTLMRAALFSRQLRVGAALAVTALAVSWLVVSTRNWSGWKGKTFWDWMEVLVIPLTLAIVAYWFGREERRTDRAIAAERRQWELLEGYFDRISKLVAEKRLDESEANARIRAVARVLTLSVLRRSDGTRRGEILKFLSEAKLIERNTRIVDLHGADLSYAVLSGTDLTGANLSGVIAKRSDLREAVMRDASLTGAVLDGANLDRADLQRAELTKAVMNGTRLSDANLSHVNLCEARLTRVILDDADLRNATLDCVEMRRCSLRHTDLRSAQCSEFVRMIKCDFRGALFQGSTWPSSSTVERCRFRNTRYNAKTTWPSGRKPPDGAIDVDRTWIKRAEQLRRESKLADRSRT